MDLLTNSPRHLTSKRCTVEGGFRRIAFDTAGCSTYVWLERLKTILSGAVAVVIIIIIIAEMAVFNVAGYFVEERRRWPAITASPRG